MLGIKGYKPNFSKDTFEFIDKHKSDLKNLIVDIEGDSEEKTFFRQLTNADFFIVGIEFKLDGMENCLHLANGIDCNDIKIKTTKTDNRNKRIKIE